MNDQMTVWVVSKGERNEGGSICGLFSNLGAAIAFVAFNYPDFIPDDEEWQRPDCKSYSSSPDWLTIKRHGVQ